MNEQQWHSDRYKDQGNTCPQDVMYYCSELYNPPKSFSNKYSDYQDCMLSKTEDDCGSPFVPEDTYGGRNPYQEALQADSKHLEDKINELEDYDPSVGYDPDALIEEWHQEHPDYEYGDPEPVNILKNGLKGMDKEQKQMFYVAVGAIGLIVLISVIK